MTMHRAYLEDLDHILAARHDNGADYWATSDGRLEIGRPISTLTAPPIGSQDLDTAAETLLDLWNVRVLASHCHSGLGTLLRQVEQAFL